MTCMWRALRHYMSDATCIVRLILIVSVLAKVALTAQTVVGHVVDSATGNDIAGVAVNLVRDGQVVSAATTDASGRFHIEAVEAGIYSANYTARGFWPIPNFRVDENFERECGRCFTTERGGQPFLVNASGDTVRLEVKMSPLGRISGRVLDDVGEPVPNASVQLHWGENWLCKMPSCIGVSRETKTNEKGEYRLTDLDLPGAWLLSATAPSSWRLPESRSHQRLEWAQTFYPSVIDPQLSQRVMVRPGGEVSSAEIRLSTVPVHRIRGVVLDIAGNPAPKATVTLRRRAGSPSMSQNVLSDGAFEFEAVPEGAWRISAKVDEGGPTLWTAQWIQLKDNNLEKLELRPSAPFAIQGKIVVEAPEGVLAPKPPSAVLAFNAGPAMSADKPGGTFVNATPDATGDFEFRNLYPGSYQILPGAAPPRYYLDSIRLSGYDALGSGVEVAPGVQPLTVVYKYGGGTVRGAVENCAGGTVRLLPRDKAMWRQGFLSYAQCDSNDRYEITAVRPGEYYLLAISGDSPTAWYASMWDDDSLIRNASRVMVRAGESSSADLRAIRQ